jgi:hypothetical protein
MRPLALHSGFPLLGAIFQGLFPKIGTISCHDNQLVFLSADNGPKNRLLAEFIFIFPPIS